MPPRPTETGAPGTTAHSDANRPRIDYREILTPAEFDRYSQLRTLRKQLADAEAVPVYTILTNAQLADLARCRADTEPHRPHRATMAWVPSAQYWIHEAPAATWAATRQGAGWRTR